MCGFSQKYIEPGKLKQFNITVNYDDYTIKTQMLSQNKEIDVDNERTYLWYSAQKIMETKGGFDGRLIHGKYRAFYLNNQLKELGSIKYGLKNKEWKYWYPDGKLKEVIRWKKGVKDGLYQLYSDNGKLMAKGHFKKDKLNGRLYTYDNNGKVLDKKKFRNGDEIIAKVKPVKEKKEKSEKPVKEKTKKPKKERKKKESALKTDTKAADAK